MHNLFTILIRNLTSFNQNDIKPNKEDNIIELTQDEFYAVAGGPQVENDPKI